VTFETTVDAAGANAPALDVQLPDGWSVTDQSATGPASFKSSTTEWVWLSEGGQYTVTYTVSVPDDAADGDYAVTAEASAIDPATDEFLSDSTSTALSVSADDPVDAPPDAPETTVSLVPASEQTTAGDAVEYDLVVDSADGGVGAFSATVTLGDTTVGTITDASVHESAQPATTDLTVASDGSAATLEAVLLDTTDAGLVTLGSVTVSADAQGETDLALAVDALGDEVGQGYDVTGTSDASLTVVDVPPVSDDDAVPTDVDGDGVYEDVNGDGTFTVADVQTLFANRQSDTVTDYGEYYDINGDGEFDIVDIQALWVELNESG
jgi:hypothetical protein